jgi:hypothetical protein
VLVEKLTELFMMGLGIMNIVADRDQGKGPRKRFQQYNHRGKTVAEVKKLASDLKAQGGPNPFVHIYAVDVMLKPTLLDRSSLRPVGSEEYKRVVWTPLAKDNDMDVLNGQGRKRMLELFAQQTRDELDFEIEWIDAHQPGKKRTTPETMARHVERKELLEDKVERGGLWLCRFYNAGESLFCFPRKPER